LDFPYQKAIFLYFLSSRHTLPGNITGLPIYPGYAGTDLYHEATLAAAGGAVPTRSVQDTNAKNVRNEAQLLLSIVFLPFRGPRAATRGPQDGHLIELDKPDRLIER